MLCIAMLSRHLDSVMGGSAGYLSGVPVVAFKFVMLRYADFQAQTKTWGTKHLGFASELNRNTACFQHLKQSLNDLLSLNH